MLDPTPDPTPDPPPELDGYIPLEDQTVSNPENTLISDVTLSTPPPANQE